MPLSCKVIKSPQFNEDYSKEIVLRVSNFKIEKEEKPNKPREKPEEILKEVAKAKAELLEARKKAEEIISVAQKEAQSISENAKKKAKELAEETKEKAYQEGFDLGQQEGYQKALNDAQREADQIRQQAENILTQIEEERLTAVQELENELIALSVQIAEKIVAAQLSVEDKTILNIVQEALQLVADRETINIFLNPADGQIIRQHQQALSHQLSDDLKLRVISDAAIEPGSCRIETDQGWIDASLESKFKEIKKSLGLLEEEAN